ncbi:hypothetical protein HDU67_008535 [Dinochytrium kinnereticum]|nr:hypothetical protein HDU67_008535 [Dinochytrium kinnereticum]
MASSSKMKEKKKITADETFSLRPHKLASGEASTSREKMYFPALVTQINLYQLRYGGFWTQFGVQLAFSATITVIQLLQIKLIENFTSTDEFRAATLTMMYSYLLFGMPSKVIRLYGGFDSTSNDILYWILVVGNILFNKVFPRIIGLLVYQRHLLSKILKVDIEKSTNPNEPSLPSLPPSSTEALSIINSVPPPPEALEEDSITSLPHHHFSRTSKINRSQNTITEEYTTVTFRDYLPTVFATEVSSASGRRSNRQVEEVRCGTKVVGFKEDTIVVKKDEMGRNASVGFGNSTYSVDMDSNTALNAIGKTVQMKRKQLKFDLDMYSVYIEDQAMVDLIGILFASGFVFMYAYEIFGPDLAKSDFVRFAALWRCIPILALQITAEIGLCRMEKYCGFRVYDGKRLKMQYIYTVALAAVSSGCWVAVGAYGFKLD